MKGLYYWFNAKSGPRKGAIVTPTECVEIDFTNYQDRSVVSRHSQEAIGYVLLGVKDQRWTGHYTVSFRPGELWTPESYATAIEAATAVRALRENAEIEEAFIHANPVEHLERELKSHDWHCSMSDDFGVARAGEAHFDLIKQLIQKVGEAEARPLFDKYAPDGFRFPG